jgi:hypothetical protein
VKKRKEMKRKGKEREKKRRKERNGVVDKIENIKEELKKRIERQGANLKSLMEY